MSPASHPRRRLRRLALVSTLAVVAGSTWWAAAGSAGPTRAAPTRAATTVKAGEGHEHHEHHAGDLVFSPAPPVFPAGAEMAVLQGDPSVAGAVFTVRLRFPSGYVLRAHVHPTDEAVTVIKGTFLVGIGDSVRDDAFLPPLHRGDFIVAPANVHHFAKAMGRTEVQVHAVGPFVLTYVNPADDPRGPA